MPFNDAKGLGVEEGAPKVKVLDSGGLKLKALFELEGASGGKD